MSRLVVHHLENSRSHRIVWLLEEMGLAYDVVFYRRLPDMSGPPELRAKHVLGKAPILIDGERPYVESGAIIEHLLDRPEGSGFRPAAGTDALQRYRFWLHFAEGSLMPPILIKLYLSRLSQVPEGMSDKVNGQIANLLTFCNDALSPCEWFAGDVFTGADIQMSYPLKIATARIGQGDRFPHLLGFIDRIRSRPAYIAAEEREHRVERGS